MGLFGHRRETPPAQQPAPAPAPAPGPSYPGQSAAAAGRALQRQNQRAMGRSNREFKMEQTRLNQDEKRIEAEIKRLVKLNRTEEARILAKNLVQVRQTRTKLFSASTQLTAIQNQSSVMQSQAKVVEAMHNASTVLSSATSAANPEKMMKMAQAFQMESEKSQLAQEMTDDALDSILGGDELANESEDVLKSVLDEIGLEVGSQIGATPVARPSGQAVAAPESEDDLMKRLAALEGNR